MKFKITVNQCVSLTKRSWPNEDHLGTINLIRMSQSSHFSLNIFFLKIQEHSFPDAAFILKHPVV